MRLLIITWNDTSFLKALSQMSNELANVNKITVLNVHKLNRGECPLPDLSAYDGLVLIQMGSGEWEEELKNNLKHLKFFLSFKSKLDAMSTIQPDEREFLWRYIAYDGLENLKNFIRHCLNKLGLHLSASDPIPTPWHGIWYKGLTFSKLNDFLNYYNRSAITKYIGILFYRRRFLYEDLKHIDKLIEHLEKKGFGVIPVFTNGFPDPHIGMPGAEAAIKEYFFKEGEPFVSALVWCLYFKVCPSNNSILKELNVPVFNAIETFGLSIDEWMSSPQGLSPLDISMSLALPELDGVIDPIVFSFENSCSSNVEAFTLHEPLEERVERIANRVSRLVKLRNEPSSMKKVAIVLHCSEIGNAEGNIGTALGLDSGQSVIEIMHYLDMSGYTVRNIPKNGQELIKMLIQEGQIWPGKWSPSMYLNPAVKVKRSTYLKWFDELPKKVQDAITHAWGTPPDELGIPGIYFGNVFVTIQPPRAPHADPGSVHKLIHDPTLPPPHQYYCFYRFINQEFDVVIHVGKHGSVEWLPGKAAGLSAECYPDICLRSIPNAYIYIVNNPSEGTQAKRRGYSTIIDHMPPPMISTERYIELEIAIREYVDVRKRGLTGQMQVAKERISKYCKEYDFNFDESKFDDELIRLHAKIEELNRSLFNYGLHVFGKLPNEDILNRFIISILIPEKFVFEKLNIPFEKIMDPLAEYNGQTLSELARDIKAACLELVTTSKISTHIPENIKQAVEPLTDQILEKFNEVKRRILAIAEIPNLLNFLDASYIEPGPSGDITRGRLNAVPTGKNFYAVDLMSIPTKSAWEVGKKLAAQLLKRFEDEGKLPETVAFVEWFTDVTNTDGEQLAEILFLLGVKPIWDGDRVAGLSVIPLEDLGRPRIDVVVRIGGLFRDTCSPLIELIDEAISIVRSLNEPAELNFVRKHFLENSIEYRIFGDAPGAYGAGVNHAINSSVWKSEEELAEIFISWGCYAYGKKTYGIKAEDALRYCLKLTDVVVRNQHTDEWDIFDDDCPYAYHGGLKLAAEKASGRKVKALISDTRNPESPKVVDVSEEVDRVVRKTLFNPEWIEGMRKHEYKGASDLMKKIVNLFGWAATAHVVENWIFQKIAETYVFNKGNREWLEAENVYALEEIIRRLCEAYDRGLWNAPKEFVQKLKQEYLRVEGLIEDRMEPPSSRKA